PRGGSGRRVDADRRAGARGAVRRQGTARGRAGPDEPRAHGRDDGDLRGLPLSPFAACLAVTVVLLALAAASGRAHRSGLHLTLVVWALETLAATIHFAYGLSRIYDLRTAEPITSIHLALARLNAVAFLLPIATGLRTWFRPGARGLHKVCAW